MGNVACSCRRRRHRSHSDPYKIPDWQANVLKHPNSTTPYDNVGPISPTTEEPFPFEIHDSESDEDIETPELTRKSVEQYEQTPKDQPYSPLSYRSFFTSDTDPKGTASLFSTEDRGEDLYPSEGASTDIFDIVLRHFLVEHYPISDSVIREMTSRNLLLPADASVIISRNGNQEKAQAFFDNFVFSEVNICKLATFLHVLVAEKTRFLAEFRKAYLHFQSIVDHIYYVVNFVSLFLEHLEGERDLTSDKYLSYIININCAKKLAVLRSFSKDISVNIFYIKIIINSLMFPSRFWTNFASINDQFRCCQELTLSSCDLQPIDVYNLSKGFIDAGILRMLDLSSNPITDVGLKYLEDIFLVRNSVVSLNIACCTITSYGMEDFLDTLSSVQLNNHLKHLNISHNDLRNMAEQYVLILTKMPFTSLEIKSINLRQQRALFESMKLNYSLKRVDLSGNKLLSNDTKFLAAGLAYNTSLEMISLATMGLIKEDCVVLNNTLLMNKSLVSIDLSDNIIGDEGAGLLKDLLTMKKTLKYLYMKRCGISLQGTLLLLKTVSESDCNLKLLDLCFNHSPRISMVVEVKDAVRKILDLCHHISLVKDIKIKLWGTVDEVHFNRAGCVEI